MDDTALRLSGDLVGASDALVTTIRQWATANARKAAQGPLGIDFSGVRRVDFACANLLLMLSTRIHQAGATIRIRGTNELVAALFQVIGIYRVAHRVPRR
jgi:ABC-type transporter Mla MlaB component